MDRKVIVSGLVASPAAVAIALWAIQFIVPTLLEPRPIYDLVVYYSLVSPLLAGSWRWWAGGSWHADVALLVSLAACGVTCFGIFFYSFVKVTPDNW